MRLNNKLILSYSLAIGIFNAMFTTVIVVAVSHLIFKFPLTWKLYGVHYIVGYIVLWLMNLEMIKK